MMNRIKELRNAYGMKQTELAKKLNVSQAALSGYETGKYEPDYHTLHKLSMILSTSIDYLLGGNAPQIIPVESERGARIKVFAKIPAGVPIEAIEDIVDFEDIPADMMKGGKDYIGFRVSGNSMYPKYLEEDTVIVRRQPDCESGQDCVVYINGYDATLKKVIKQENGLWLQPLNPSYEPKFYPYDGDESVTILGVVVEVRRRIL